MELNTSCIDPQKRFSIFDNLESFRDTCASARITRSTPYRCGTLSLNGAMRPTGGSFRGGLTLKCSRPPLCPPECPPCARSLPDRPRVRSRPRGGRNMQYGRRYGPRHAAEEGATGRFAAFPAAGAASTARSQGGRSGKKSVKNQP